MAESHSHAIVKVDLRDLNGSQAAEIVHVLHTPRVEVVLLNFQAGEDIPVHEPQGDIILQCLIGAIELSASETVYQLQQGQLLYLPRTQPFSIRVSESGSLLMTIVEPQTGGAVSLIGDSPEQS